MSSRPASPSRARANARMLSSSRYRTSPPAATSTPTSDRSTSRSTTSTADSGGRPACRARARPRPGARHPRTPTAPTGRAGRRGTAGRSSSRWLPPGRVAGPGRRLVGSRRRLKRSSIRRAISWTDSDLTRAAASSIASGSPSSARHTSSTTSADSSSTAKSRRALVAREPNSVDRVGRRQRVEHVHHLARKSQRHLARGQHRQSGRTVEQPRHQVRHGVDHVLTVVEQQDRLGPGEPVDQLCLTARDLQRLGNHPRDRRGLVHRVETHQPDAACGPEATRELDRRTGLADPGGADDRHQPVVAQQVAQGGQLVGPPHELGGECRQVADPASEHPAGRPRRRARGSAGGSAPRGTAGPGPGSTPSSSTSRPRTRAYAASASAWRPAR